MVFASPIFLFLFFPIVLGVYFLINPKYRNNWICFASFIFYAWGGIAYAILIFISTIINYFLGIMIGKNSEKKKNKVFIIALVYNVGILIFFKYFGFIIDSIVNVIGLAFANFEINAPIIPLPIGISFFTFQIISYIVDVYKEKVKPQKSLINLGLYIMLFPQLIAGPIVRYIDIEKEIQERDINILNIRQGLERFIIGLGKKVILANAMGEIANFAFDNILELNTIIAWVGIIGYSLQIYLDFSAYSDMAIGLGKIFGFNFQENFNYPYISTSVKEFWNRWHISLSSWFRDYIYIPLGGNRKGRLKTYRNLIVVFLLTGLWHGAAWNFVVWGLFHGIFLIIERCGFDKVLKRWPKIIQHIYMLVVVSIGWVFFRSTDIIMAGEYLKQMFSFNIEGTNRLLGIMNNKNSITLLVSVLISMPIFTYSKLRLKKYIIKNPEKYILIRLCSDLYLVGIYIISLAYITGSSFNPFIYFKF